MKAKALKIKGLFPIMLLMRLFHPRVRRWFRLRLAAPRNALAWLKWALDFKGRAAVRAYLDECERRISESWDDAARERMACELAIYGRTEIRLSSSVG
jgi:hypothetical protein